MFLNQVPFWATFRNRHVMWAFAGGYGMQLERAPVHIFVNIERMP
jgi:hypothetical protein